MKANKKKLTVALAGLLALVVLVGTWAYFTSTNSIANEMLTKDYGVKTVEEFTPKQELQPGKTVEKKAGITNTGGYPLVVRMRLDEKWVRGGTQLIAISSNDDAINSVAYDAGPPPTYRAIQAGGLAGETDGLITGDETVMYKKMNLAGWTKGSDGYWYLTAQLAAGATTGNFLESLTMATNADMGLYTVGQFYSTADKQDIQDLIDGGATEAALEAAYGWTIWPTDPTGFDESQVTFIKSDKVLDSTKGGYANADYTLTITTEVCQATKEAVEATWNMSAPEQQAILNAWGL